MTETTASTTPHHASDAAELTEYVDTHGTVLVEFYTNGCGLCASMVPVLGAVAKKTDVPVVTVNPRDDPVLIDRFEIRSVPALVLVHDGEVIARIADGFLGVDEVVEFVEANLEAHLESDRRTRTR